MCQGQAPLASDLELFEAARAQDVARTQLALERGANPNARDELGQTPLLLAIHAWGDDATQRARSVTMTRLLLQFGADPNLQNNDGSAPTPLMRATNKVPVLKLLLDAGADVNRRNQYGDTALTRLCQWHRVTLASLNILLEGGADPNTRDSRGRTPLMLASARDSHSWENKLSFARLADVLLAAGAQINAQDEQGQTALMEAAYQQQTSNVVALLARGADVNARDKRGQTALMHALEVKAIARMSSSGTVFYFWPSAETVKLLLENGADVNTRDSDGQSALVRLAKLNARAYVSRGKISPEMFAKRNSQTLAIARALIEHGADVSLRTNNGNTALKWAKARGNTPLIGLLQKTANSPASAGNL